MKFPGSLRVVSKAKTPEQQRRVASLIPVARKLLGVLLNRNRHNVISPLVHNWVSQVGDRISVIAIRPNQFTAIISPVGVPLLAEGETPEIEYVGFSFWPYQSEDYPKAIVHRKYVDGSPSGPWKVLLRDWENGTASWTSRNGDIYSTYGYTGRYSKVFDSSNFDNWIYTYLNGAVQHEIVGIDIVHSSPLGNYTIVGKWEVGGDISLHYVNGETPILTEENKLYRFDTSGWTFEYLKEPSKLSTSSDGSKFTIGNQYGDGQFQYYLIELGLDDNGIPVLVDEQILYKDSSFEELYDGEENLDPNAGTIEITYEEIDNPDWYLRGPVAVVFETRVLYAALNGTYLNRYSYSGTQTIGSYFDDDDNLQFLDLEFSGKVERTKDLYAKQTICDADRVHLLTPDIYFSCTTSCPYVNNGIVQTYEYDKQEGNNSFSWYSNTKVTLNGLEIFSNSYSFSSTRNETRIIQVAPDVPDVYDATTTVNGGPQNVIYRKIIAYDPINETGLFSTININHTLPSRTVTDYFSRIKSIGYYDEIISATVKDSIDLIKKEDVISSYTIKNEVMTGFIDGITRNWDDTYDGELYDYLVEIDKLDQVFVEDTFRAPDILNSSNNIIPPEDIIDRNNLGFLSSTKSKQIFGVAGNFATIIDVDGNYNVYNLYNEKAVEVGELAVSTEPETDNDPNLRNCGVIKVEL